MKDYTAKVKANKKLYDGAYALTLEVDDMPEVSGGQFAMLTVPPADSILRRPLGIVTADSGSCSFIYQVKGKGTDALTRLTSGDEIMVMLPLGNGFPKIECERLAIVGGGFGVAPLLIPAKENADKEVRIYNGFATKSQIMLEGLFEKAGKLKVCTDDGSYGFHGFPSQALENEIDEFRPQAIFCCGPEPLMRAVKRIGESRGTATYLSLEQRMGCGVGACLTCTCKAAGRNKRVCKDGPVFLSTEVFE